MGAIVEPVEVDGGVLRAGWPRKLGGVATVEVVDEDKSVVEFDDDPDPPIRKSRASRLGSSPKLGLTTVL